MSDPGTEMDRDLINAASLGNVADATLAIQLGGNINCSSSLEIYDDVTPLMTAVRFGHFAVVRYLVEAGAALERRTRSFVPGEISRETALHWAIRKGDARIVRLLVAAGANVNSASNWGSVLQYAIEENGLAIVKLLVSAGASVHLASGREQYMPMHIAASQGRAAIIRFLASKGAKLKPRPISGKTPLLMACIADDPTAAVKELLKLGADPEHKDKQEGRTALMWAAWHGSEDCVKLLLRHGASVAKKDHLGKTAWDIAHEANSHAAKFWIEKAGGRSGQPRRGWPTQKDPERTYCISRFGYFPP